jgi:hypothetical protein
MEGPTLAQWSAPVMKPATLVPVESCGWRKRFTSPSGLPRASELQYGRIDIVPKPGWASLQTCRLLGRRTDTVSRSRRRGDG